VDRTGAWTQTAALAAQRAYHSAILLWNGKVLVSGGFDYAVGSLAAAEVYDPATRSWALAAARAAHTATLLPNGKLLVTGGFDEISAALYDVGLGFQVSCEPEVTAGSPTLSLGGSLVVSGVRFRGISGASSGSSQDSATDYPLVHLRSLESGQTTFLLSTNWQTNYFASAPVWQFPPGYALVTVFVNGIPSTGSIINISVPVPTPTTLGGAQMLTNGAFQFCFTNSVGALLGVLATTNPALPLSNWTVLGGAAEVAPRQFQFTDAQAANSPARYSTVGNLCYPLYSFFKRIFLNCAIMGGPAWSCSASTPLMARFASSSSVTSIVCFPLMNCWR
jgi:hypothetical protein